MNVYENLKLGMVAAVLASHGRTCPNAKMIETITNKYSQAMSAEEFKELKKKALALPSEEFTKHKIEFINFMLNPVPLIPTEQVIESAKDKFTVSQLLELRKKLVNFWVSREPKASKENTMTWRQLQETINTMPEGELDMPVLFLEPYQDITIYEVRMEQTEKSIMDMDDCIEKGNYFLTV